MWHKRWKLIPVKRQNEYFVSHIFDTYIWQYHFDVGDIHKPRFAISIENLIPYQLISNGKQFYRYRGSMPIGMEKHNLSLIEVYCFNKRI